MGLQRGLYDRRLFWALGLYLLTGVACSASEAMRSLSKRSSSVDSTLVPTFTTMVFAWFKISRRRAAESADMGNRFQWGNAQRTPCHVSRFGRNAPLREARRVAANRSSSRVGWSILAVATMMHVESSKQFPVLRVAPCPRLRKR